MHRVYVAHKFRTATIETIKTNTLAAARAATTRAWRSAPKPASGRRTKININNITHPYLKDTQLNTQKSNTTIEIHNKIYSMSIDIKITILVWAFESYTKNSKPTLSVQQLKNISSLSFIQWYRLSLYFWALLLNLLLKKCI